MSDNSNSTDVSVNSSNESSSTKTKISVNPSEDFTIRVLTLNCWGLWIGSKKRHQRMAGIVRFLRENNCDIVFLQEVWVSSDFEIIRNGTKDIYRFAHLYRAGSVLGSSGIVILCKWVPKVIHFEPYQLNGSPFYPWHGDWFAGKGIAYSRVDFDGLSLHLFSTHTHAYYNENEAVHDQYSVHRVYQSYQLARFITLIRDTASNRKSHGKDLIIVAGDMNTTSSELPYKILTTMAQLNDCDSYDEDVTYCHPKNTFSPSCDGLKSKQAPMKRIDFILTHGHCLVDRIATESKDATLGYSISDHEPVMVELKICDDLNEKNHIKPGSDIAVMGATQDLLMQYYQYNRASKIQLFYIVLLMYIVTLPTSTYYALSNELIPISTIVFVWFASSFLFAIGVLIGFVSYRSEQGSIEAALNEITCKIHCQST